MNRQVEQLCCLWMERLDMDGWSMADGLIDVMVDDHAEVRGSKRSADTKGARRRHACCWALRCIVLLD